MMQKQDNGPAGDIAHILEVLAFEKIDDHGGLRIENCYPGGQSWVQAALLKKSIDIEYKFSEDCDLSGKFTASYLDKIPLQFTLRNLEGYKAVKMLVKLNIRQSRTGIIYGFDVQEGLVTTASGTIPFTAKYKVLADPLTNEINENSEEGQIVINKVSKPFKFN